LLQKNTNSYLNSLTNLEIGYLANYCGNGTEKNKIIKSLIKHYNAIYNTEKHHHQTYRYQSHGIGWTQASRFANFAKKTLQNFDIEQINKQLNLYVEQLNNNNLNSINDLLCFLEEDIKRCKKINRFCFHETTSTEYLIKKLIHLFRLNANKALNTKLQGLKRALAIYDFYFPYIKKNEIAAHLIALNTFELSTNKNIRSKYVEEFGTLCLNNTTCLNIRMSIGMQLINDFSLAQNHKSLHELLKHLEQEICLNPYINQNNNYILSKIFHSYYAYLKDAKKSLQYYFDMQRKENISHPNETFAGKMSSALDMLDTKSIQAVITQKVTKGDNLKREESLFISKYFLIRGDIQKAYKYIKTAFSHKPYKIESILFDILWATYFNILYELKEFQLIITEFEKLIFKKNYSKVKNEGFACLDIKLIYIASKYKLGLTRTDSFHAQIRGILNILNEKYYDLINQLKIRYTLKIIEKQVDFNEKTKKEINKIYANTQILVDMVRS